MANDKLTPQQRAMLFGASTRQHFQMLGMQEAQGEATTMQFRLPKARIVQGIKLHVKGKVNAKHATTTSVSLPSDVAVYDVFRRISVDFNNGFMPVSLSGSQLALNNMLYTMPEMIKNNANGGTNCKCPSSLVVSSAGTDNVFEFVLEVPLALNHRDPVGLVLAQNSETSIDVNLDINTMANVFGGTAITYTLKELKVTPMVESFSIPSDSRAFPDFSVLKVLDSRVENITQGQNYVKMQTGMIYRKLIFKFEKADGSVMTESDITSNIELVLNTADTPYSISPAMLKAQDRMQAGLDMPEGVYYFSFDWQGINGYGGSRDYIDSERVSEFAVRFNSGCAGKLTIISEKLSRLLTSSAN